MRAEDPGFVERFRTHAAERGAATALRWLERGERVTDEASYAALDRAARIVAANLLRQGLRGRPVLFLLPQGLDFVRCFLGCFYAGAIAVPVPLTAGRRHMERAATIAAAVRPGAILARAVDAAGPDGAAALLREAGLAGVPVLTTEDLLSGEPAAGPVATTPDDIALLQYTSGSTSAPKGVVVTHRNLAVTLRLITEGFSLDAGIRLVSWLPLHHDMGLIGCVLEPLFLGGEASLMSPLAFLQRPMRWLRAMQAWQANTAGAPNFAYDLCQRTATEAGCRDLDLSAWRLAFCGAEPVRAATMRRFAARFAPHGFDAGAFYPCYGLAEATLFVAGGRAGDGVRTRHIPLPHARGLRENVSCGFPRGDTRVAILDPREPTPVAPGAPGEICVSGAQVSPGFWSATQGGAVPDTDRTFAMDGRHWLRTGDLGLIAEGDLHVVGRLKSMIIIRGANIYAVVVEQTALALDGTGIGTAAAIPVLEGPEETLVLVCEIDRGTAPPEAPEPLLRRLAGAVAEIHGVLPAELLLVAPGAIERTPSGKLRRARLRERYEAGEIPFLAALRGRPAPGGKAPAA
jgi:acyl-CoA synthetase (AMP-forming)/AMP-acid ligase II